MKQRLSWWEYEHFLNDLDYIIIGGGIVGLSTAIELKKDNPDSKVVVLDKKNLPIGASTKNAGFACFGSISEIWEDYNSYGAKTCEKLIKMRWEGLSILKSRVPKEKMQYENKPGAEVFEDKEEKEFYKNKLDWVNELVSPIVGVGDCFYAEEDRFGSQIINKLEGSLNPQLMMSELEFIARKKGVLFISGIEVTEINFKNKCVVSNYGHVNYKNLIVCTNGFSKKILPELDIRPARNQVLITNRIPGLILQNCYHMNKGYIYFREYDGRLLIGGGRHLDEIGERTDKLETTELIMNYLSNIIDNFILPEIPYKVEHTWSGILGVGGSKMPIVQPVGDNAVVAIRMGGMGVAIGSFIGKVAASMIQSKDNRAYQLYVS